MPSPQDGTRQRKHLSNIGLRRQQTSHRRSSTSADLTIQSHHCAPSRRFRTVNTENGSVGAGIEQEASPWHEDQERNEWQEVETTAMRGEVDNAACEKEAKKVLPRATNNYEISKSQSDESEEAFPHPIVLNPDLNILPVEKTEQAKGAFDFYINSFAISIIEVSPENIQPYSNLIHQILHDEMLFIAFTTCSEASRWRTLDLYENPPLSVVKGYGRTISLLTQRLQRNRFAMSPSILLTMSQLVAIEILIKNVSATARHLAGMQAAMKPKHDGGTPIGPKVVQNAVDIWAQYFMQRARVHATIPKRSSLTYPQHPFNPKMSMQIADLPAGFADIALSGRLSEEMLTLLEVFNNYFGTINRMNGEGSLDSPERTYLILQTAAYCIEYHLIRSQTIIERLLVTAMTAYVVRRDRIHPAMINMRNYYQITCGYLANLIDAPGGGLHKEDQGSDLVIWAGLMLLLTSTPEAQARKLALKLLPKHPEPLKLLKKCQRFFWDGDLTNVLLSGKVLAISSSNDIVANHVNQVLTTIENQAPEEK